MARRRDPQRIALLAQQRVAAVARAVAPDLAGLGEVGDVLRVVAGPRHVGLPRLEGRPYRVQAFDEEPVLAHLVQRRLAHPGHRAHREDHVLRVGDLHTELGILRPERAHAERHHVHGPATHTAPVQVGHDPAHLGRVHPVVGRARVDLTLAADEGAGLDARHVRRVGQREVRIRLLLVIELVESAGLDQLLGEPGGLFL